MKPRMLTVMIVFILISSLNTTVAAPTNANGLNVSIIDIDLSTYKAGANDVGCDITLEAWENIEAGDVITLTFDGFDLSDLDLSTDSNDDYKYFRFNGNPIAVDDLVLSGNQITLYVIENLPIGINVTFEMFAQAGLGNPEISQEMDGTCCDQDPMTCACGPDAGATICGDQAPDNFYEINVNGDDMDVMIHDHILVDGTSFSVGDTAIITGTGFSPGATLHISGGFAGNAEVGPDGTAIISAIVTGNQQPLFAQDTTGRKACIPWAGNFNLLPTLIIEPDEGIICTPMEIRGYNYTGTPTQILIGGQPLYSGTFTMMDMDADGNKDDFRVTGVAIPRTLGGGLYQITCQAGSTYFNVNAQQITITPPAGPPNTEITIEGSGFCPKDDDGWAIMMYGSTTAGGTVTHTPIEVDSNGEFTAAGHIPWGASSGVHGIMVVFDPDDHVFNQSPNEVAVQGMFTVTSPELSVYPDIGPFGYDVTLNSASFGPEAAGAVPKLWVNFQLVPGVELSPLSPTGHLNSQTITVSGSNNFELGENIIEIRVEAYGQIRSAATTFEVVECIPIQHALATIMDKCVRVWTYDAPHQQWRVYQLGLPGWIDMIECLETGQGYWIEVTEDCTLTYNAIEFELKAGWNLIGWVL